MRASFAGEKKLLSFESPQKSFFEGASKADILGYLEDAKERGLENLVGDTVSFEALAEDAALDKIVSVHQARHVGTDPRREDETNAGRSPAVILLLLARSAMRAGFLSVRYQTSLHPS